MLRRLFRLRKPKKYVPRAISNGDEIIITWLPPCVNGRGGRNPYIGMHGTVQDLKSNGNLVLKGKTGVLVINRPYRFSKVKKQVLSDLAV